MGLGMPLIRPSGRGGKSSDLTCQQAHTSKPAGPRGPQWHGVAARRMVVPSHPPPLSQEHVSCRP